jgi:hypothetical protein
VEWHFGLIVTRVFIAVATTLIRHIESVQCSSSTLPFSFASSKAVILFVRGARTYAVAQMCELFDR